MKASDIILVITCLLLIPFNYVKGGCGCGNNSKQSTCCPKAGTCTFDPYTGNEHRAIRDLEIWGGVGEVSLVWMRYYNSREFKNWSYSFQYSMADGGFDNYGQAQVVIYYPERPVFGEYYTQSTDNSDLWLPLPGIGKRIFQQGNNYFLQMSNGFRYRFEKLNTQTGDAYYQLQDFRDTYQNLYKLTYNSKRQLKRVIEPAGRYLEITYTSVEGTDVISSVSSYDGRSVQYNYESYNDGITSWPLLMNVDYKDGTQAVYHYSQPVSYYPEVPLGFIFLDHAIDPRLEGSAVNMKFTYDNSISTLR